MNQGGGGELFDSIGKDDSFSMDAVGVGMTETKKQTDLEKPQTKPKKSRKRGKAIDREEYSRKLNQAFGFPQDIDFSRLGNADIVLVYERVAVAKNVPNVITALLKNALPEAMLTGFDLLCVVFKQIQGLAGGTDKDFPILRGLISGVSGFFKKDEKKP